MKSDQKKKGGKRKGAGRKPSGVVKSAVTVYTDVSRFGGKEGARIAIYAFLDGGVVDTGKRSFMPIPDDTLAALRNAENKLIAKKKAEALLKPQEQPKPACAVEHESAAILAQIEAIKAEKIPAERNTVFGKKAWQLDQQKRIQELKNKLI